MPDEVAAVVPRRRCQRDRGIGRPTSTTRSSRTPTAANTSRSRLRASISWPAPDGGYQLTTGTSVAAAHISGVVALLKERNPQLKAADVRNILAASARYIGPVKTDIGAGLVDPMQAFGQGRPDEVGRAR